MNSDAGLVFLPGLAGRADEFREVVDGLGPGRRAVGFDLPTEGELSIRGQAEQISAAIKELGLKTYLVVGHSQGGTVALELAAIDAAVRGVVIVDSPVQVPLTVRRVLGVVLRAVPEFAWPALLRRFFAATFSAADGPWWRAGVLDRLADLQPRTLKKSVTATFTYDAERALTRLRVPAMYVRANIPTRLDRLPAGVRGVDLSGSGHWAHVHRPAAVRTELQAFLSSVAVS